MKVATVFALTLTTAAAFQQVKPAFRPATSALFITKEEDLELTRKVIQDFQKGVSTTTAPEPAEPEPEAKKEPEPVASKEE